MYTHTDPYMCNVHMAVAGPYQTEPQFLINFLSISYRAYFFPRIHPGPTASTSTPCNIGGGRIASATTLF